MHEQQNELQRLLNLSIQIKKLNDEIRVEIEKRMIELTMMIDQGEGRTVN